MRHTIRIALGLALPCWLLGGCLTTRELITVNPDGQLDVSVQVEGNAGDLADGYPLPTSPAWQPADEATADWLRGSRATGNDSVKLTMKARFAGAAAMPERWAPPDAPYPTAWLARSASLTVDQRGGRTVYTFERRLLRRPAALHRIWDETMEAGKELGEQLEDGRPLDAAQHARARQLFAGAFRTSAAYCAREAVGALYTEGDAGLPLELRERVLARVAERITGLLDARVDAVLRTVEQEALAKARGEKDGNQAGPLLSALEEDVRQTLRSALRVALADTGVAEPLLNGVLYRLEWIFTSSDHTQDLEDEKFETTVRMPGTVVSGNWLARDGDAVTWHVEGKELLAGDAVMRVVSVVE